MWTKTKIAIQQANELRDFVKNLAARRITTPEFKSALMILRQHCGRGSALLEWTDSVAHQKRDRGITFEAGNSLWLERFQVNAFFNTDRPRLSKIPIPIFERLLNLFKDPEFRFHGIDLKTNFPGGHSRDEFLASLNWMYRKVEDERAYKLVSGSHKNVEDLELMRHFLGQLETSDWGEPPYHFNAIRDGALTTFRRLIGPSKRVLEKNGDLLALHFLSAFHLTEVDLDCYASRPKTRCFLSVDSTASGHLCLSLGLYVRENGEWDAVGLAQPKRPARFTGSHCYTRPFLITDLEEAKYFWNGTGSEVSFCGGVKVVKLRNGTCLLRPFGNKNASLPPAD